MSQFGGVNMPPPGPPISMSAPFGQAPHMQSFNGYESHNAPGYGTPPPMPQKGYPPPQNINNNMSVQNGPAMQQPYASTTPTFSHMSSQPMPVPPPDIATDQMSQRFSDINLSRNANFQGYSAMPSQMPPAPQRPPMNSAPSNFRPPQPDGMRQPYPQHPNMQSSISGPYRLSHPPIQQTAPGYSPNSMPSNNSDIPHPGDNAHQYPGGPGVAPSPTPPPVHSMPSNSYGSHPQGPPGPSMQDRQPQKGAYYGSSGQMSPGGGGGGGMPPSDHTNGHMMSSTMPPYPPQMPMQSRYPPAMTQPQGVPQGMPPPQSQFAPQGMNNAQNRMAAPLPAQPAASQRPRLDPDHMPSPIQVIEEDKKLHGNNVFVTSNKGQAPPLVTTNFVVQDGGICSPRFMRSTIYTVPTSAELLKQTSVPFGIVLSPFARLHEGENAPPISDLGETGPVRCIRCKAYMCPYIQFIDGGRRFQCVFCKATTEVPPEYFSHLDHVGERVDKYQRPELCLGSYEIVATKEYCKNSVFPQCPAFIFAIDVSYNSIRNGMVRLLCNNMKAILSNLPREDDQPSKIKIGFITYSNTVHFYNIKSTLAQPQVMVVPDVEDMCMPLFDGFFVDYEEAEPVIASLLQQIPEMYAETRETETVLGPAIQAGLEALKTADCAGKLFIFHSTLPIAEAPGKLKNRDDRKLLGTEKEKTVLTPQNTFYNNLGQECVAAGCCVDLFLFPNAYIDVATIGQVCRLTGGQVYKYTYFQSDIDGARFLEDLKRDVQKPIAFDAIIRVRTSTGIRPTEFWGNFFMSNTTDIEVAAIDCDKAIAVEIKFDDKLTEDDGAYVQAAILYTSCSGQRRLRLHNMALNTSAQMADMFRCCELDTILNLFSKEAVRMISEQTPRQVKDHFIARSAQILACYRKHCANRSSAGQLILPECTKLLPLYINCLIKSDAIAGGQDMSTDERSYVMLAVNSMTIETSACYFYPRMLPLNDISTDVDELPTAMRCTIEKMKDTGIYLIENGLIMFLWVGLNANPEWIQDVFAVPSAARIDIDSTHLVEINTPLSRRVRAIVSQVQEERQRFMRLVIVRQGDKLELVFRQLLVEDRTTEGSASYVDFLCHLHKEIRSLLT